MKMNVSMGFVKPLGGALKKYKALMPSVVILVVAMLLFLPLLWLGGKVRAQVQTSAGYARDVRSLMSTPPREKVQQVKASMDQLEQEAEAVHQMAVQSTRRNLVTYDYVIFPKPTDPSSQVYNEFGQQYRAAIESLLKKINAKDAPSEAEIRAKTGTPMRSTSMEGLGGFGSFATAKALKPNDPMVDALCLTRAQEISVYANPNAFSWYEFWDNYQFTGRDQALQDCWDSQVAMWIYEDVIDTVLKMNGTSVREPAAPVKRLLGVRFTGPVIIEGSANQQMYPEEMPGLMMGTRGTDQGRDIPNYVTATLPSHFVLFSPTGRIGNDDVDIVHFALSVVVDNRSVLTFMKELCSEKPHTFYPSIFKEPFVRQGDPVESRHNQISILESDTSAVDQRRPGHELYRYGKGASVRLDLVCEYLFVREGYDMIKPDLIKKRLGQPTSEGTSSAAPAGIGR